MLESIQKNVTWRAVLFAGIVGGTVFLLVNMLLTTVLFETNPGLSLRYIASLVMGSDTVNTNSADALLMGVVVHYILSLFFALVITIVIHRWGLLVGIVGGGLLGLAIYAINLYTFTVFFPWFFAINSPALLVSHVLFGMVVGGVYELFDHYDTSIYTEERVS